MFLVHLSCLHCIALPAGTVGLPRPDGRQNSSICSPSALTRQSGRTSLHQPLRSACGRISTPLCEPREPVPPGVKLPPVNRECGGRPKWQKLYISQTTPAGQRNRGLANAVLPACVQMADVTLRSGYSTGKLTMMPECPLQQSGQPIISAGFFRV